MRVLLTGGAGYIGSHIALQLSAQGHRVVVCDNLSNSNADSVLEAQFYQLDIAASEMEALFEKHRFDAVVHCAASVSVPESMQKPYEYYVNNISATLQLLKWCARYKISYFILSSTAAVYGEPKSNPITEKSDLKPINPYGYSKCVCEQMLADIARQAHFQYSILRYFNVAGAEPQARIGENSKTAEHLIKRACLAATSTERQINVYGSDYDTKDGTCVRDYIHVMDIADAHILMLDYLSQGGQSDIFNCGYGYGYSVKEIIAAVQRIARVNFAVRTAARRAGDPPLLIAANRKIKAVAGWQPRYENLDLIIKSALTWEKKLRSR